MKLLSTGRKGLKKTCKAVKKIKKPPADYCMLLKCLKPTLEVHAPMLPPYAFVFLCYLSRTPYSTLPFISKAVLCTEKLQNWHLTECVTRQVVQCFISLPVEKLANEVLCSRLEEMYMITPTVWHLLTPAIRKLHAKHNPHNELRLSSHKVNKVCFS